jgi:hypothetical protein
VVCELPITILPKTTFEPIFNDVFPAVSVKFELITLVASVPLTVVVIPDAPILTDVAGDVPSDKAVAVAVVNDGVVILDAVIVPVDVIFPTVVIAPVPKVKEIPVRTPSLEIEPVFVPFLTIFPIIFPFVAVIFPVVAVIPPDADVIPNVERVPKIFVAYVELPIFMVLSVKGKVVVFIPIPIPPVAVESHPRRIGPVVCAAVVEPHPI